MRRFRIPEIALGFLAATAFWLAVAVIYPKYYGAEPEAEKSAKNHGVGITTEGRLADYTWWLVAFTGVLAISTIGLWIVTWRAGVRQTRDMNAALGHAEKALTTVERAFVFIDDFNVELSYTFANKRPSVPGINPYPIRNPIPQITYFAVQPKWSNSGSTPTRRMTIRVCWHNPSSPFADDYAYRFPASSLFVAPKAIQTGEFVEITGGQALIDYGWNPVGQEPLMLIWGRADYEDVFDKSHFIEWCYRVRFDRHNGNKVRAQLIQWGPYNRSDIPPV